VEERLFKKKGTGGGERAGVKVSILREVEGDGFIKSPGPKKGGRNMEKIVLNRTEAAGV